MPVIGISVSSNFYCRKFKQKIYTENMHYLNMDKRAGFHFVKILFTKYMIWLGIMFRIYITWTMSLYEQRPKLHLMVKLILWFLRNIYLCSLYWCYINLHVTVARKMDISLQRSTQFDNFVRLEYDLINMSDYVICSAKKMKWIQIDYLQQQKHIRTNKILNK